MISRIRGVLLRRSMESAEVMTPGGVGYEVEIPLTVYERLPPEGEEVEFITYYLVREDEATLFGFLDAAERALFGRLMTAPGVGPRLALAMLSRLSPERLVRAITEKDVATLRQVPGLGPKKAKRVALELADKLDDLAVEVAGPGPRGRVAEEAVGALVALGYSAPQATAAVREALDEAPDLQGTGLIKAALSRIASS